MAKKILILGAGYAGIRVATQLRDKGEDFELTIVDKNDYHTEKTCLHEVASGQKSPESITYPIEECIKGKKSRFIKDEVVKIDKDNNTVTLKETGVLDYDYLVVGLGFQSETFGVKGAKENALMMADLDEAVNIHKHILNEFSQYEKDHDKKHLRIVVIGAGFTGIELLGALAEEMPKYAKQYGFHVDDAEIICLEHATRILPMFSDKLADYAIKYLEGMDVSMLLGARVDSVSEGSVEYVKDDQPISIEANTIIWTTGVSGVDLIEESGFAAKRGRVVVKDDLTIEGYDNIFMLGDVAAVIDPENNRPYATTAQIALAMSTSCAENILRKIAGRPTEKFVYVSKGTVCSLGNTNAIALVGGKELKGYPASALKKIIATRSIQMGSGRLGLTLKKGRFDLYR